MNDKNIKKQVELIVKDENFCKLEIRKKELRKKIWKFIPQDNSQLIDEYCDLCEEQLRLVYLSAYTKGVKDGFNICSENFTENKT